MLVSLKNFFIKLFSSNEHTNNGVSKTGSSNSRTVAASESPTLSVSGKGVSQGSEPLIISCYSAFPRFYTINGIKYDIDDPDSIRKIPTFNNILRINGKPYGMDTILFEHYRSCSDSQIGYAAYEKSQEFRKKGIVNLSDWEKELEQRNIGRQQKEESRKKQCNSFSIEDMYQFSCIPFGWRYVMSLNHTDGIPWFMLNWNNQQVALHYISQLNDIILDAKEFVPGISTGIDFGQIDYDYPTPMTKHSMCSTRVECYPYTSTGKISKYPAVLVFATKYISGVRSCSGEIKIMRDGNIGSALIYLNGKNYKFSLHGVSLVLKRVDDRMTGKNLFYFSE